MQVAVISDVHANLHALRAVLESIGGAGVDEIWCLGDTTGYGADPNECCALVEEHCQVVLAGNHDLVVVGKIPITAFSSSASVAAKQHMETIDATSRALLENLEPQRELPSSGVELAHASPRDPIWEYVLSLDVAAQCMRTLKQRICLIGHSHVACYFSSAADAVSGDTARAKLELDIAEGTWILNPGAVGQPRDGDPRAAYLVIDFDRSVARYERVEYPVEEAAKAILSANLPASLAERLYGGH